MILSTGARWLLRLAAAAVLTFIYAPLVLVALNAFSTSVTSSIGEAAGGIFNLGTLTLEAQSRVTGNTSRRSPSRSKPTAH